jgi:putative peptidoglycan lipid II flippase
MATVSFHAARNAGEKLYQTLDSSLKLAACLTFPATVGLIAFRYEIVRLLYERGSFLPSDTLKTSQVVLLYALGLFSYSAVKVIVPTFYVLNDTRTPVRMSLVTVAVKVALNLVLAIPFGFLGLALATTVASWLNFVLLLNHLRRQRGLQWHIRNLAPFARIALAALAMGFLATLVFHESGSVFSGAGAFALALRLGLAILAGVASLFPLLRVFKVEEGSTLFQMVGTVIGKIR